MATRKPSCPWSPRTTASTIGTTKRASLIASTRPTRVSAFAFGALDRLTNERRRSQAVRHPVSSPRFALGSPHRTEPRALGAHARRGPRAERPGRPAGASGSELRDTTARLRLEASQRVSPELRLRGGADAGLTNVKTEVDIFGPRVTTQPARVDFAGGAYADAIWRPARAVEIVPGLRFDLARSRLKNHAFVEPRLGTRLRVAQGVSWVSAFGIAHQLPTQSVRVPGRAPNGARARGTGSVASDDRRRVRAARPACSARSTYSTPGSTR